MTIKTNNIYKLFSREDVFNFHKVYGFISLIHFVYQYVYLLNHGVMNLISNKYTPILLGIHSGLSLSSLIFRVPLKRHTGLPIINKEIRAHSIIFGMRSIICALGHYYNLDKVFYIMVINITMILADIITRYFKSSTTTMRDMAFGNCLSAEEKNKITLMHSRSQFGATLFLMLNINTAFSPLFAIQLAVFLMTLVRKSIIQELDWHRIYTLSLWINILLFWSINTLLDILLVVLGSYIVEYFRIKRRINKYVLWNIVLFTYYYMVTQGLDIPINDYYKNTVANIIISLYLVKNIIISKALWF